MYIPQLPSVLWIRLRLPLATSVDVNGQGPFHPIMYIRMYGVVRSRMESYGVLTARVQFNCKQFGGFHLITETLHSISILCVRAHYHSSSRATTHSSPFQVPAVYSLVYTVQVAELPCPASLLLYGLAVWKPPSPRPLYPLVRP